jgi:hypothetical protein
MTPIISIHTWLSLSDEVRYRIRSIFLIPRSSNTVVSDGKLETDGTTNEDFKHLTVEKMQTYLNDTSTDFYKLFDKVIDKVKDELAPTPKVIPVVVTPTIVSNPPAVYPPQVVVTPKKRGRPAKKNA